MKSASLLISAALLTWVVGFGQARTQPQPPAEQQAQSGQAQQYGAG